MFATALWPGEIEPSLMDAHSDVDPVTDREHDTSWSANLETTAHASDRSLVTEQAVDAVEKTAAGYHVNLVTHAEHGHPETYLYPVLDEQFGEAVDYEYVDQCGCGGHVLRVFVD